MKTCSNCNTVNPSGNNECIVCSVALPDAVEPNNSVDCNVSADSHERLYFEVMAGKFPGHIFPLTADDMIVGRQDKDATRVDIDLSEQDETGTISRQHIRCVLKGGRLFIEDLSSTNGTSINEPKRLEAGLEYEVKTGDIVALGSRIALKLKYGDV